MIKSFSVLFLALVFTSSAVCAPVWKISKGNEHLYVGGTVHLLSQQDYPLPAEFEKAYQDSEIVVFETDIAAMSTPAFQQKTMQLMTFTDGTTLSDVLSTETIAALEKHLSARNIPLQNMMTFKPSLMYVTLSVIELQMIGLTSAGVDQYYATKALGDGKTQQWLESPDQQLEFLVNLGKGEEDSLIAYTLKDLKRLPTLMEQLKAAWRAGDMANLEEVGIKEFKQEYPDVYRDLLTERNNNWIPQIEAMMTTPETEFVLVGALHLAGPDSVFALLKDKGYTIEKL